MECLRCKFELTKMECSALNDEDLLLCEVCKFICDTPEAIEREIKPITLKLSTKKQKKVKDKDKCFVCANIMVDELCSFCDIKIEDIELDKSKMKTCSRCGIITLDDINECRTCSEWERSHCLFKTY